MSNYSAGKEDLKGLLAESVRLGVSFDAKFNEGNTLLHFAVALDMYDEVVYLLDSGANYLITNKEGRSPRDIALESGNQRVLSLFRRESWYRAYCYADNPAFNPDFDSKEQNSKLLQKLSQPAVGYLDISYTSWYSNRLVGIFEDHLNWTDTQICAHLQDSLERFRQEEQAFLSNLEVLKKQKQHNIERLTSLHRILRNHEHRICKKLFTYQELVRQYRDKVNSYAEEKMFYKREIQSIRKKVYFNGVGQQRVHNGYVLKLWRFCTITVTGEYLIVSETASKATNSLASGNGSLALTTQDLNGTELDMSEGQDYCVGGTHRIPLADIYYVETVRSGFHSSHPCVAFGITLKKHESNAVNRGECRHLESVSTKNSTPSHQAAAVASLKLKRLTISIPAIPLDTSRRPSKNTSADDATNWSEDFPVNISDVSASFFDQYDAKDHRYAHYFLLSLRATNKNIKFGGNYLPPGWAVSRRKSLTTGDPKSGHTVTPSSQSSAPSTASTSNDGCGVVVTPKSKGKIESLFDRIFSSSSSSSPLKSGGGSSTSLPAVSKSQIVMEPKVATSTNRLSSKSLPVTSRISQLGSGGIEDIMESTHHDRYIRDSGSTSQASQSYYSGSGSSSMSSSSLPRMSSLYRRHGSNADSTSRSSESGRESSILGRPSLSSETSPGEQNGFMHVQYAPRNLETVAEREERQFSSDSEGQFSCKLAAHLAGIVAESVSEQSSAPIVNLHRKKSASLLSGMETSSCMSPNESGAPSDLSPRLGWEIIPESIVSETNAIASGKSSKQVHYGEDVEYMDHADELVTIDDEDRGPKGYDVESLSGPSMLRSKSLPFKLPSSGNICHDQPGIDAEKAYSAALTPGHLANISTKDSVSTSVEKAEGEGLNHEDLGDWRSVCSDHANTTVTESINLPSIELLKDILLYDEHDESIMDSSAQTATADLDAMEVSIYSTPEKPIRQSFAHPLGSPCVIQGIVVNTTESGDKSISSEKRVATKMERVPLSGNSIRNESTSDEFDDRMWAPSRDQDKADLSKERLASFQSADVEDVVAIRIKSNVLNSPSANLVRATPDSPETRDAMLALSENLLSSPLTRKSIRKNLPPADSSAAFDAREDQSSFTQPVAPLIEPTKLLFDETNPISATECNQTVDIRMSSATGKTDASDDYGYVEDVSFSHNSVYEFERNSSSHRLGSKGIGIFRDTRASWTDRDSILLGLVSDPDMDEEGGGSIATGPTSRMTFSSGVSSIKKSTPCGAIVLDMLPAGGIDSPSILSRGQLNANRLASSSGSSRLERASFCNGSPMGTTDRSLSDGKSKNSVDFLKVKTPKNSGDKSGKLNFRTLDDAKRSLDKIRQISAVAEERLTISLNDREIEHQKFTYLLALRGIVDHLPLVEDRVKFLSNGCQRSEGYLGASGSGYPVGECTDSVGVNNNNSSYSNINSSHSATAILAAASASFAAAGSACYDATIDGNHGPNSVHSMGPGSEFHRDVYSEGFVDGGESQSECRVVSQDYTESADFDVSFAKRYDILAPPSPLVLSSNKSSGGNKSDTNGVLEDVYISGRLDSISTSRVSSSAKNDRDSQRRSVSKASSALGALATFRNSIGPVDRPSPILSMSPTSSGFMGFRQSSDSSSSQSSAGPIKAYMSKESLKERFGDSILDLYNGHPLPPVTALLCVPMGQPPADLLDKYNTIFEVLKTIYSLDKAIFDHIQRLAEISHLKDDIRSKYWSLQNEANKVTAPRAGELYDIDL